MGNLPTTRAFTPTSAQLVTVYLGPVEVRKFGQGAVEEMTEYPTPDIRLVRKIASGSVVTEKTVLHRDGLGSVRAVTSAAGLRTETAPHRPGSHQAAGCGLARIPLGAAMADGGMP